MIQWELIFVVEGSKDNSWGTNFEDQNKKKLQTCNLWRKSRNHQNSIPQKLTPFGYSNSFMEILWIALKLFWGKSNISMSLIFSHAFPKQPLNNFRSKKTLNRKLHFLCSEKCTQCSQCSISIPCENISKPQVCRGYRNERLA